MSQGPVVAADAGADHVTAASSSVSANIIRGHIVRSRQLVDHFWLAWPLHVDSWTRVPLAVPELVRSRQSPDWTPLTVPSELTVHCWLTWPLQVQMIALVPGVVPCPLASRQRMLSPL